MRAYLILVLMLCLNYSHAQTISAHFPVENFHMNESHSWRSVPDYYRFNYEDGSLFVRDSYVRNNKTYYSLYYNCNYTHVTGSSGQTRVGSEQRYVGSINYDTLTSRLYLDDKLVYDFKLNLGDVYPITTQNPYIDTSLRVRRIDTIIDLYNITRKVFYVARNNNSVINTNYNSINCAVIIEGIGNVNGLLSPLIDCFEDCTNQLECLKINNKSYVINNSLENGICNMNNNKFANADFPDSNYFYNESRYQRPSDMFPDFNNIDYTVYYKKDTIVNSVDYHLLNLKYTAKYYTPPIPTQSKDIAYALLRNDKINKKVYITGLNKYNDFNLKLDTNERLLFDFDLQVGDLYKANAHLYYSNNNDSLYVLKIDTIVDPDNIKRAVFTIGDTDLVFNGYVIQGIGGVNGLLGYISEIMNNSYTEEFKCYSINDIDYTTYFSNFAAGIEYSYWPCDKLNFVSVNDIKKKFINLYPNPASNIIQFDLNEKINNIKIYNSQGKIISNDFSQNQYINIENYLLGIYFVQIISDQNIYNGTFIKIN